MLVVASYQKFDTQFLMRDQLQATTKTGRGGSSDNGGTKPPFKPVGIDPTKMFKPLHPMVASSSDLVSQSNKAYQLVDPAIGTTIDTTSANKPGLPSDLVSDMTQSLMSSRGIRLLVCDCVKKQIFPLVKFYDKDEHNVFSVQTDTVCGIVLHFAHMAHAYDANEWWYKTRGLVHQTHTIHRNNCIKAMHNSFMSTYVVRLW